MQHHLKENGRSEAEFGRNLIVGEGKSGRQGVADALRRWRDAGHTHGTIQSTWLGLTTPEQHLEYFVDVAERVRR